MAKKAVKKQPKVREPRVRNSESLKNIKRIDSTKTHGWQVHVRRGGELRTKLFSDRVFKGKRNALQAAKDYREGLLSEMAHLAKPLWKIDRTPKTNTGHLGASYTEYTNRSGEKRGVITVTVRESLGKPVNRKFSVSKLGYEEALKQALAWRDSVLQDRERRESGLPAEAPKTKPKAKAAPVSAPAKAKPAAKAKQVPTKAAKVEAKPAAKAKTPAKKAPAKKAPAKKAPAKKAPAKKAPAKKAPAKKAPTKKVAKKGRKS